MTNTDLFRAAHSLTRNFLRAVRERLDYRACFVGALNFLRNSTPAERANAAIAQAVRLLMEATAGSEGIDNARASYKLFDSAKTWEKGGHQRLYINGQGSIYIDVKRMKVVWNGSVAPSRAKLRNELHTAVDCLVARAQLILSAAPLAPVTLPGVAGVSYGGRRGSLSALHAVDSYAAECIEENGGRHF